jgi:predicted metal-dependent peptidase
MAKDEVLDVIFTAFHKLEKDHPYYGPALRQCRLDEDPTIETFCIDANLVIRYNREFCYSLYKDLRPKTGSMSYAEKMTCAENVVGVLLHELLHYISDHHSRRLKHPRKNVPHELHNIAMDMEINQYIEYKMSEGCCHPDNMKMKNGNPYPRDLSYEEYLELLLHNLPDNEDPNNPSPNAISLPGGCDVDMRGTKAGKTSAQVQGLKAECEAAERNSGIGSDSSLSSALQRVQKIQYNWERVFRSLVRSMTEQVKFGFNHSTYMKPNRHLAAMDPDIIYPSRYDMVRKIKLVVGMDVSGSMYGLTEKMYGIMKSITSSEELEIQITVLECDTQVTKVIEDFKTEKNEIDVGQGGGTDMGAISTYVRDKKMNPDLIVIMTDNYTGWDPVLFKDKTVVMTNNVTPECPYKQYNVCFEIEED